jgi:hypothetical protein
MESPAPQIMPSVNQKRQQEAKALVKLKDDGGLIALNARGNLTGTGSLSPAHEQAVKLALSRGELEAPTGLEALSGRASALMGAPERPAPFSLLSPVAAVVRSTQPNLRWTPLFGDKQSYRIIIANANGEVVEQSESVPTTEWTARHPLIRGKIYTWQVIATTQDGREYVSPAASERPARFKVLEQERADELKAMESAHANFHLLKGVLYTRYGLFDEAMQEFHLLSKANPGSSVPSKLLQKLNLLRRSH